MQRTIQIVLLKFNHNSLKTDN